MIGGGELIQAVIDRRLTYLTSEKLTVLMKAADGLNSRNVLGDFVEFGVALGGSAICIASKLVLGRAFYGFDNFDLIPSPEPVDGAAPNRRYDVIRSGKSIGIGSDPYYGYEKDRLALVLRNFEAFGMPADDKRIVMVKGLYADTLPDRLPARIVLAHLDCDWYSPVKQCLDGTYPRLSDGGMIVVDDYGNWDGCTKATDEFRSAHADMYFHRGGTYAVLTKRTA